MTTAAAAVAPVRLHLPDEPVERREIWRARVDAGEPIATVIEGPDGVGDWLWARWRVLEGVGFDRTRFDAVLSGSRRELWLWLAGERTWSQAISGLTGRVTRRLAS